ncbi:hypothetical protein FNF27_05897 [Cafeteria roenbergensis]|uniref:CCR4-NOT transcription complex subunit 3 n=2 Tax=Cafeteria roenbergensis TaxID=33653 RepID=A0A5A8E4Q5_CAFRO|nr:hypothetical protein FNF27_05897 [Cafeteria roenbergensis]
MAALRKTQIEIEKTLKLVKQGIIGVEELWVKVDEADTHELRVKHEGDLKRAIKKLQRHRDNLKMWASSSEIKQKDPLVNCRRAIEEKMEAFKTLEYETKHKTYSRAGMTASGELDEEGLARKDARDFLSATIADLSAQIDELEADMETERSKRRPDTKLLASLEETLGNHHTHIHRIEQLTRLLDNLVIPHEDITSIRDDLTYYVESNREPDFAPDMELYDRFDVLMDAGTPTPGGSGVGPSSGSDVASRSGASDTGRSRASSKKSAPAASAPAPAAAAAAASAASAAPSSTAGKSRRSAGAASGAGDVRSTAGPGAASAASGAGGSVAASASSAAPAAAAAASSRPLRQLATSGGASLAAIVRASSAAGAAGPASRAAAGLSLPRPVGARPAPGSAKDAHASVPPAMASVPPPAGSSTTATPLSAAAAAGAGAGAASSADGAASAAVHAGHRGALAFTLARGEGAPEPDADGVVRCLGSVGGLLFGGGGGDDAPIGLGIAFDPDEDDLQAMCAPGAITQEVERAFAHVPEVSDIERSRAHVPRHPVPPECQHPAFQMPPPACLDEPATFDRLKADTLFFAFYFMQGTHQQSLAARQLLQRSWRLHSDYGAWFQRFSGERTKTDTAEIGACKYFDFESTWAERVAENFEFRYDALRSTIQ